MKALPLKLWLELEDDVIRHKAEIAQQFAQARARLLPPDAPACSKDWPWGDPASFGAMRDGLFGFGFLAV